MKKSAISFMLMICLVIMSVMTCCVSDEKVITDRDTSEPATEESVPAQTTTSEASVRTPYDQQWIDKDEISVSDDRVFDDIRITEIYSDCFFARTVIPMPYEIKLNGELSDDWCVGDQVICTYENVYYDVDSQRIEADMLTIEESDFELEAGVAYKPVIYLYPQEETQVSVKLDLDGEFLCTYPEYNEGWTVTASPDGTLTDGELSYNYLFWEGKLNVVYDFSEGFCVKGSDTAEFLETSLEKLGLNRKEANEFIVFWLERMQSNPYNVVSFRTDDYTEAAKLQVSPEPDTMIRVFMTWYPSDVEIDIPEQVLTSPERSGFTVVEWGGQEVR